MITDVEKIFQLNAETQQNLQIRLLHVHLFEQKKTVRDVQTDSECTDWRNARSSKNNDM